MGGKLSTPGGDSTAPRSPRMECIHTAYKRGAFSRARDLLREACEDSTSPLEKVESAPCLGATLVLGWMRVTAQMIGRTLVGMFCCTLHNAFCV